MGGVQSSEKRRVELTCLRGVGRVCGNAILNPIGRSEKDWQGIVDCEGLR